MPRSTNLRLNSYIIGSSEPAKKKRNPSNRVRYVALCLPGNRLERLRWFGASNNRARNVAMKISFTPVSLDNILHKKKEDAPHHEATADSKDRLYTEGRLQEDPIQSGKTHIRQQNTSCTPCQPPPEKSAAYLNTLTQINTFPASETDSLLEQPILDPNTNAEACPILEFDDFNRDYPLKELYDYHPPVVTTCSDSKSVSCDCPPLSPHFTNHLQGAEQEQKRFHSQNQSSEQYSPQVIPFLSQSHKPLTTTTTPPKNQKNLKHMSNLNNHYNQVKELIYKIKSILSKQNESLMNILELRSGVVTKTTVLLMANKSLASLEKKPCKEKPLSMTETAIQIPPAPINQIRSNTNPSSRKVNPKGGNTRCCSF